MEHIAKCLAILKTTEQQLLSEVSVASSLCDYAALKVYLDTAQSISRLAKNLAESGNEPALQQATRKMVRPRESRGRKTNYPWFVKRGTDLVKVGWSKKDGSEYEHKAPWKVVRITGQLLTDRSTPDSLLVIDQLLPIINPDTREPIPSYQVYVALAWLKAEGLLIQHGRQGYALQDARNLLLEIERRCKEMTSA